MDESNQPTNKQTRKKGCLFVYTRESTDDFYNKVNNNSTAIIYFIWLRLILPDPTAIRVGLSHASQHSNMWHTAQ
jgi:hypothetical protein